METFNNREIAAAFWLLILAVLELSQFSIRKSCRSLLMVLYVLAVVVGLRALGVWSVDLLKDTIVWLCFTAVAMMVRFCTTPNSQSAFREVATDSLKIAVLLEFLVNTYTFPLIVELTLVPLVACIAVRDAIAHTKDGYARAARLTTAVLTVLGLTILGNAIGRAIADWREVGSLDRVRSVAIAPLLSLLLLPFMYGMLVHMKYEQVFLRLDLGTDKTPRVKRYARRRIVRHARLSLRRLDHLLRNHPADLMHVKNDAGVDEILLNAKTAASSVSASEQQDGQR